MFLLRPILKVISYSSVNEVVCIHNMVIMIKCSEYDLHLLDFSHILFSVHTLIITVFVSRKRLFTTSELKTVEIKMKNQNAKNLK